MQPDYKTARRQLTGNMPTGSYNMSGMEFSVSRKVWDTVVAELKDWPKQEEDRTNVYITSLDDALRWCEEQQ